jgi:ribosomal protein L11 methyltransferase
VIRLAVRVRREHAEIVLAELLQLSPAGVEEVAAAPDVVEYAVYGSPGELPSVPDLDARVGDALVEVSATEIADDWHERWKQFHRPVLVTAPARRPGASDLSPTTTAPCTPMPAAALYVRPPWENESHEAGVLDVAIDPGQAFGTGAHATTRLCLELMLEMDAAVAANTRGPLLDIGTGSGVLAIAAAKLGFEPVLALDNDRYSVHAAAENARANGTAMEVRRFDLRDEALPLPALAATGQPITVTANLLAPLLIALARALQHAEHRVEHLIAGGLLRREAGEISRSLCDAAGLHERSRREEGDWAALWLNARAPS